ncbi:MAG TPA: hypothetical protein VFO92_02670 [Nitrososphaeraceae archaeon]|nr:hypothetical protein [Nitrososphaeraceae archaeon]
MTDRYVLVLASFSGIQEPFDKQIVIASEYFFLAKVPRTDSFDR